MPRGVLGRKREFVHFGFLRYGCRGSTALFRYLRRLVHLHAGLILWRSEHVNQRNRVCTGGVLCWWYRTARRVLNCGPLLPTRLGVGSAEQVRRGAVWHQQRCSDVRDGVVRGSLHMFRGVILRQCEHSAGCMYSGMAAGFAAIVFMHANRSSLCAMQCPSGRYCVGADAGPILCSVPGFWCPAGAVSPNNSACAAGRYGTGAGAASYTSNLCHSPCSAEGYWCPEGSSSHSVAMCAAGFFGPANGGYTSSACAGLCTSAPGFWCPPGSNSPIGVGCSAGHYCGGGSSVMGAQMRLRRAREMSACCSQVTVQHVLADTALPWPLTNLVSFVRQENTASVAQRVSCRACVARARCSSGCSTGVYDAPTRTNLSVAVPCPPGSFNPNVGGNSSLSCLQCPGGYFGSKDGASTCNACGAGYFSKAGALTCSQCPAGTFAFQNVTADACILCPGGTYSGSIGAVSPGTCAFCPAGTSSAPGGGNFFACVPCGLGTFSSGIGNSECSSCPPGSFASSVGLSVCTLCPANTFSMNVRSSSSSACIQCPEESSSVTIGAGSVNSCLCPAGHFVGGGPSRCTACAPGTYNSQPGGSSASACTFCPAGSASTVSGAMSAETCKLCDIGSFTGGLGNSACFPCPRGSWSNITGSMACELCVANTYNANVGVVTAASCVPCPVGTVSAAVGASSSGACVPLYLACRSGTVPDGGSGTSCVACGPGTYADGGACQPCARGTYSELPGQVGRCPDQCAPGTYGAVAGALNATFGCNSCPVGTYNDVLAASSSSACVFCPAGTASSSVGSRSLAACFRCELGSFAAGVGNEVCSACPRGSFGHVSSRAQCEQCPVNTYSFVTGAKNASTCVQCPRGSSSSRIGADSRDSCVRLMCEPGWEVVNGTTCAPCSAGTFADDTGKCVPCVRGTFSSLAGSPVCTESCPVGSYGAVAGATELSHACVDCPPGSVSVTAAQACSRCPMGFWAPSGSKFCVHCLDDDLCAPAAGFSYSVRASNASTTTPSVDTAHATDRQDAWQWSSYAGVAVAGVSAVAFFGSRMLPMWVAALIDIFPADHYIPDGAPLVKRTSQRGAACTIAFLFAASVISAVLLAQFVTANVLTAQALVPLARVMNALPAQTAWLIMEVVYESGDADACNLRRGSALEPTRSGITSGATNVGMEFADGECHVRWEFLNVSLDTRVVLSIAQPAWLQQHVRWNLSCASGLSEGDTSSVSGSVSATKVGRLVGDAEFVVGGTVTHATSTEGTVTSVGLILSRLSSVQRFDEGWSVTRDDVMTLKLGIQVCGAM